MSSAQVENEAGDRRRAIELASGERLGRYLVVKKIATGGMAELYLARATGIEGFEKLVALKRIRPEFANDGEFVRMFLDEARLAALLQHPNIVQVFDVGVVEGEYFFAMEYIDGVSVRTLLQHARRNGVPIPLEHAVAIGIAVAAALHHAHHRRTADGEPLLVVHRDVSPSNVLVSRDGAIKLVDFGIAKATRRSSMTRAGTVKGKAAYMSPEQCRGEAVDHRSDVFSLGVVLYELTTGFELFEADNDVALAHRLCHEDPPPPSRRRRDYPPELEAALMGALQRDRDRRTASAEQLRIALEKFAASEGLVLLPTRLARYVAGIMGESSLVGWLPRPGQGPVAIETGTVSLSSPPDGSSWADTEARPPSPGAKRSLSRSWLAITIGLPLAGALGVGLYASSSSRGRISEPSSTSETAPARRSGGSSHAPADTPASRPVVETSTAAPRPAAVSPASTTRAVRPKHARRGSSRAAHHTGVVGRRKKSSSPPRPASPRPAPALDEDALWPR